MPRPKVASQVLASLSCILSIPRRHQVSSFCRPFSSLSCSSDLPCPPTLPVIALLSSRPPPSRGLSSSAISLPSHQQICSLKTLLAVLLSTGGTTPSPTDYPDLSSFLPHHPPFNLIPPSDLLPGAEFRQPKSCHCCWQGNCGHKHRRQASRRSRGKSGARTRGRRHGSCMTRGKDSGKR